MCAAAILAYVLGGDFKTGLASKLYGVNHVSVMTTDINKTLDFYINELGGYLIDDIQPSHLQSESLSNYFLVRHNTNKIPFCISFFIHCI